MKNSIVVVTFIIVAAIGCKPRKQSSGLRDTEALPDDKALLQVQAAKMYDGSAGIHVNNHEVYSTVYSGLEVVRQRNDDAALEIKLETISFFLDQFARKKFDTIQLENGSTITPDQVFAQLGVSGSSNGFGLTDNNANDDPADELLEANKKQSNQICQTIYQCFMVVEFLETIASSAARLEDSNPAVSGMFLATHEKVKQDLVTLPAGRLRSIVAFRWRAVRAKYNFYNIVQFEDRRRPFVFRDADSGKIDALKKEFDFLIRTAELKYLDPFDPTTINKSLVKALVADRIVTDMRDYYLSATAIKDDSAFSKKKLKDALTESNKGSQSPESKEIVLNVTKWQQVTASYEIDTIATGLTQSHTFILAARAMLDRALKDRNDAVLEMLSEINAKVQNWEQKMAQLSGPNFAGKPIPDSQLPNLVSPALAFQMLYIFFQQELALPFRAEYLKQMQDFRDQIPNSRDQSEDSVKKAGGNSDLAEASQALSMAKQFHDRMNENLIKSVSAFVMDTKATKDGAGQAGHYLLSRERDLAKLFPKQFHSLADEMMMYASTFSNRSTRSAKHMEKYNAMVKTIEENKTAKIKKMVDPEEMQKSLEAARAPIKDMLVSTLEMACLEFAVKPAALPSVYRSPLESNYKQCHEGFLNNLSRIVSVSNIRIREFFRESNYSDLSTTGQKEVLADLIDLAKICGYQLDSSGNIIPPVNRNFIRNKLANDRTEYDKMEFCANQLNPLGDQVSQIYLSLITMPLMAKAGEIPFMMLSRLYQYYKTIGVGTNLVARGMTAEAYFAAATMERAAAMNAMTFTARAGQAAKSFVFTGLRSFASAFGFELANRGWMHATGMQKFPTSLDDWHQFAGAVAGSTVVFGMLGPIKHYSNLAASRGLSVIPSNFANATLPYRAYSIPVGQMATKSIAWGIPFGATTLFFAETHHLHDALNKLLGVNTPPVPPSQKQDFSERLLHAFVMTLAFDQSHKIERAYKSWENRFIQRGDPERILPPVPESEIDQILKGAKEMREARLGPFHKEVRAQFEVAEGRVQPKGAVGFEKGYEDNPYIDLRGFFGLKKHNFTPQELARANERLIAAEAKATKEAKSADDIQIVDMLSKIRVRGLEILSDRNKLYHYDMFHFHGLVLPESPFMRPRENGETAEANPQRDRNAPERQVELLN